MTTIHRNGLSGLVLRGAIIAIAAILFGCAPRVAGNHSVAQPAPVTAAG